MQIHGIICLVCKFDLLRSISLTLQWRFSVIHANKRPKNISRNSVYVKTPNLRGLITFLFGAGMIILSSGGIWSTGFCLSSSIVPKYLIKALKNKRTYCLIVWIWIHFDDDDVACLFSFLFFFFYLFVFRLQLYITVVHIDDDAAAVAAATTVAVLKHTTYILRIYF